MGVRVLTDADEIAAEAAVLATSPQRRLRAAHTTLFRIEPDPAVDGGVTRQVLCRAGTPSAHVRLRDDLPVALVHVDDSVALVGTGSAALLVRDKPILAVLATWFDLLWTDPLTARGAPAPLPAPLPLRVLRMMPHDDDTAIARKLGLSVSTVRRHIKALYLMLDVDNRFAAGVAATKRGWL